MAPERLRFEGGRSDSSVQPRRFRAKEWPCIAFGVCWRDCAFRSMNGAGISIMQLGEVVGCGCVCRLETVVMDGDEEMVSSRLLRGGYTDWTSADFDPLVGSEERI